jgi:hypothetical protein
MSHAESETHRILKRLALAWAQEQGFRIAAAEVSLPRMRFRLDVAAYKPTRHRVRATDSTLLTNRLAWIPGVGSTAVFECKASRADFIRDAASIPETLNALQQLHAKRQTIENELRIHYPSIQNGDSLFQDYQTVNYERPGHERYRRTLKEIGRLTAKLHAGTKFERLTKWGAANLFYVVAEPNLAAPHELPPGWGLLVRDGGTLALAQKPILHELAEPPRIELLHRIAAAATRAVNQLHGINRMTENAPSSD